MMRAEFTCDVCQDKQMLEVSNAPGDLIPSSPPDWVFVTWQEQTRVLPPALDDAAEAAYGMPGNLGPWMEATMSRNFATEFHICAVCRETPLGLADLAKARLRERQERQMQQAPSLVAVAPPLGGTVVPLRGLPRPAPPEEPEPPPKPYADCPLWNDTDRIGVLGRCKDRECLKNRRCKRMEKSPLVFIHEADAPAAEPPPRPRRP